MSMIDPTALLRRLGEGSPLQEIESHDGSAAGMIAMQLEHLSHLIQSMACACQQEWRLSRTQARTIVLLDESDNGLRAVALGRLLSVSSSVVSEIVASLLQRGLVLREKSERRHRGPVLLTSDGKALAAIIRDWDRPLVEVLRQLSPGHVKHASEFLNSVIHGISTYTTMAPKISKVPDTWRDEAIRVG